MELIFYFFCGKFNLSDAMVTNQIERFGPNGIFGRGVLKKHFCKSFIKIAAMRQQLMPIAIYPSISLWKIQVAIATKVLEQQQYKHTFCRG